MESLEEADRKIDELAANGRLDPALLLMMAKAYAGSKETDITREEVGAAEGAGLANLAETVDGWGVTGAALLLSSRQFSACPMACPPESHHPNPCFHTNHPRPRAPRALVAPLVA